jgi:predicted RNase H-like HicB family nuclease
MKKDLKYYMGLMYPITIAKDVEQDAAYYIAELPDLPGCGAHGKTVEEALKSLEEAKELWIETSLEKGMEIPEPVSDEEFSGKILLRIPPTLHMKLTVKAKKEELSLNQFIRKSLEQGLILEAIQEKLKIVEQKINELQKKPSFVVDVDMTSLKKPLEGGIRDTSDKSAFDLRQSVAATGTGLIY